MSGRFFSLELLRETFAICRLDPSEVVPDWAVGEFVAITRTTNELSLVCSRDRVPGDVKHDSGWRCLSLAGQFDLSEIGVLVSLIAPLAEAKVSVLVIGTFDTDYLLVKQSNLPKAMEVLESAGHRIGGYL